MATQKNRINAYVDDPAFEAFKAFCAQWQVSHSKGVELLIKQFLLNGGGPGSVDIDAKIQTALTPVLEELEELRERIQELDHKDKPRQTKSKTSRAKSH